MSLPELLDAAGYNRDEPADVERFYLALRSELNTTIRALDLTSENGLVEVIDAP
jgi:hypothetical protein